MDIHKYPLILIPTPSRGGKIADIFGYLLNIHLVIYPLQKFHFLLDKLCDSPEAASFPRSRVKPTNQSKPVSIYNVPGHGDWYQCGHKNPC